MKIEEAVQFIGLLGVDRTDITGRPRRSIEKQPPNIPISFQIKVGTKFTRPLWEKYR
jgi:hypothetical protein